MGCLAGTPWVLRSLALNRRPERFYVQNARELLTTPGSFYSGVLGKETGLESAAARICSSFFSSATTVLVSANQISEIPARICSSFISSATKSQFPFPLSYCMGQAQGAMRGGGHPVGGFSVAQLSSSECSRLCGGNRWDA